MVDTATDADEVFPFCKTMFSVNERVAPIGKVFAKISCDSMVVFERDTLTGRAVILFISTEVSSTDQVADPVAEKGICTFAVSNRALDGFNKLAASEVNATCGVESSTTVRLKVACADRFLSASYTVRTICETEFTDVESARSEK